MHPFAKNLIGLELFIYNAIKKNKILAITKKNSFVLKFKIRTPQSNRV